MPVVIPPTPFRHGNGGRDALPLRQSLRGLPVYGSGDPRSGCLGDEALGAGLLPSGPAYGLRHEVL